MFLRKFACGKEILGKGDGSWGGSRAAVGDGFGCRFRFGPRPVFGKPSSETGTETETATETVTDSRPPPHPPSASTAGAHIRARQPLPPAPLLPPSARASQMRQRLVLLDEHTHPLRMMRAVAAGAPVHAYAGAAAPGADPWLRGARADLSGLLGAVSATMADLCAYTNEQDGDADKAGPGGPGAARAAFLDRGDMYCNVRAPARTQISRPYHRTHPPHTSHALPQIIRQVCELSQLLAVATGVVKKALLELRYDDVEGQQVRASPL